MKILFVLAAVEAAAVVALGLGFQYEHRRAAEAGRAAEAARLEAERVTVARQASERQLREEADAARAEVVGFAAALDRAEHAAKTHPVAVARASTGALPVEPSAAPAPSSGPQASPACVLRVGDVGKIDVATAELRTEAGNRVLVQAAQASRVDPDGAHLLFGGELRTDLTRYSSSEVAPAARRGLGVGPLALCLAGRGCSYGAAVAAPPLWRFELSGGLLAGEAGTGFEAQLIYRF